MNLHLKEDDFSELISITSQSVGVPEIAVRRDYLIVKILNHLSNSEFAGSVVFKGGTSLSKCYPNSINRFSEDIDLTYVPDDGTNDKQISKELKRIEKVLVGDLKSEKIGNERSNRNKSSFVWLNDENKMSERIKLEIGSQVRPHPCSMKTVRSYIHEYLVNKGMDNIIDEFDLCEVNVNTLDIERTFVDKLFSVRRHAICGTLGIKVRHIYDVTKLYNLKEIQAFLSDKARFKEIIKLTKDTDSYYLGRRPNGVEYNPIGAYDFDSWKDKFDEKIVERYHLLHKDLLYSDKAEKFEDALKVFEEIGKIMNEIGE